MIQHRRVKGREARCQDSGVFKLLLVLENGEPYDPAKFVTVIPSWSEGSAGAPITPTFTVSLI